MPGRKARAMRPAACALQGRRAVVETPWGEPPGRAVGGQPHGGDPPGEIAEGGPRGACPIRAKNFWHYRACIGPPRPLPRPYSQGCPDTRRR